MTKFIIIFVAIFAIKEASAESHRDSEPLVASLVARKIGENDDIIDYVRDHFSGLVWRSDANLMKNWKGSVLFCQGLTDLGLRWHLPTKNEFLKAGNRQNTDLNHNYAVSKFMVTKDRWFWSSTPSSKKDYKFEFIGDIFEMDDIVLSVIRANVACVGKKP